ncbi:MAG: serine protease [Ruegeria sp.]
MSKAEKLAEWTRLSVEDFERIYEAVQHPDAFSWNVIIALSGEKVILGACQQAEQYDFLTALAKGVANRERRLNRPTEDIEEILNEVASFGVLQAMTDQQRGFMNRDILYPLIENTDSCMIVYEKAGEHTLTQVGTGFLLTRDLVLTAAHVALATEEIDGEPQWSSRLRPSLAFKFIASPRDPEARDVWRYPASERPLVSFAKPHATPPNVLNVDMKPPANDNLDFALIRLSQTVQHVEPIKLKEDAVPELNKPCWVFGYPGGNQLVMDVNNVANMNDQAGRWQHLASAARGMSGGCCMNHLGEVVGLHEGTIKKFEGGEEKIFNRGIRLTAIRAAQKANGKDPLKEKLQSPGLEFRDDRMVRQLYRVGLDLSPDAAAGAWRTAFESAVGSDATGPLPAFHPWFPRESLENWVLAAEDQRLCMIFGERGSGKSFCANIFRSKVATAGDNLFALSATQTNAIGWQNSISEALATEDAAFRTTAALARYSDTDAVVNELRRRWQVSNARQFVVLDFGFETDQPRLVGQPWLELVRALVVNDWIKIALIGLSNSDRSAVIDQFSDDKQTEDIGFREIELRHISRNDFQTYARKLTRARGKERTEAEIRAFVTEKFDGIEDKDDSLRLLHTALAAIEYERGLK